MYICVKGGTRITIEILYSSKPKSKILEGREARFFQQRFRGNFENF